jgi:hypothetical protein
VAPPATELKLRYRAAAKLDIQEARDWYEAISPKLEERPEERSQIGNDGVDRRQGGLPILPGEKGTPGGRPAHPPEQTF